VTGVGCLEILITLYFFHIHFHSIAPSNFNINILRHVSSENESSKCLITIKTNVLIKIAVLTTLSLLLNFNDLQIGWVHWLVHVKSVADIQALRQVCLRVIKFSSVSKGKVRPRTEHEDPEEWSTDLLFL
jgi:hypothetical protein